MKTSGNPALSEKRMFSYEAGAERMTISATVTKTAVLFLILCVSAFIFGTMSGGLGVGSAVFWAFLITGFIIALVITFKPVTAPLLAPVYSIVEGGFLGILSGLYNQAYPGIALQAVMVTMGIFSVMLVMYMTKTIVPTERFKSGLKAAFGGILVSYVLGFVMSLFGFHPGIFSNGWVGILFSLIVAGVASFSLILDFEFIDKASKNGAPRFMEWYGAFALILTLVWLYMTILRLLSKLQGRD